MFLSHNSAEQTRQHLLYKSPFGRCHRDGSHSFLVLRRVDDEIRRRRETRTPTSCRRPGLLHQRNGHSVGKLSAGSEYPRFIQISGRVRDSQSDTDGAMPPQSSLMCCSAIYLTGTTRPFAVRNSFSEYALALVDAKRMMPQCPVPEVAEFLLAIVEPPVYRSVIVHFSAEAADR